MCRLVPLDRCTESEMDDMTDPRTRVLVAARLSRVVKGKDQISIEKQDASAERYASEHDAVIIHTAADAGVSGSVSPFRRPALGPFLTQPDLISSYDEIVASALDRLGRSARDLARLRDWAEDNHKRLTILSPRLAWPPGPEDFSSGLIFDVLGRLAEIELQLTRKRYAETRAFLSDRGSLIGRPCWGFIVVGTKADKTLKPDPAKLPYLRGMISRALTGSTMSEIAQWLDTEPEARPRHSATWAPKSVSQILRNASLAGRRKDDRGRVVVRHDSVISAEEFARLQAKLDSHPKRRGPTRNDPALLTDVLYCGHCGGIMHARRTLGAPRKDGTRAPWSGYRCDGSPRKPSTCRNMIRADTIESWVTEVITASPNGDLEVIEQRLIPARGHAEEIAEIEADLRALDFDAEDFEVRQAGLLAARRSLRDLGADPARFEDVHTGESVRDRWERLSPSQRRDYLLRAETTIAFSDGLGELHIPARGINRLRG